MLGRIHQQIRTMKCDNYGSTDEEHRNQSQSEMGMDNVIVAFLHNSRQVQHLSQILPSRPVPLNYVNVYREITAMLSHRFNLFLDEGAHERPIGSWVKVRHYQYSQCLHSYANDSRNTAHALTRKIQRRASDRTRFIGDWLHTVIRQSFCCLSLVNISSVFQGHLAFYRMTLSLLGRWESANARSSKDLTANVCRLAA